MFTRRVLENDYIYLHFYMKMGDFINFMVARGTRSCTRVYGHGTLWPLTTEEQPVTDKDPLVHEF